MPCSIPANYLTESYRTKKFPTHRNQRTLAQGINPIFIPQHAQQLCIQTRLEDLNVDLIILVCMDTKVLDLVQRNRLVFRRGSVGRCIILWVGAECSNVDFSGRDCAVGVDLG